MRLAEAHSAAAAAKDVIQLVICPRFSTPPLRRDYKVKKYDVVPVRCKLLRGASFSLTAFGCLTCRCCDPCTAVHSIKLVHP